MSLFARISFPQAYLVLGTVDPNSLEVSISDEYRYATNDNYSVYTALVGLSDVHYLLLYFDSSFAETTSDAGGSGQHRTILPY